MAYSTLCDPGFQLQDLPAHFPVESSYISLPHLSQVTQPTFLPLLKGWISSLHPPFTACSDSLVHQCMELLFSFCVWETCGNDPTRCGGSQDHINVPLQSFGAPGALQYPCIAYVLFVAPIPPPWNIPVRLKLTFNLQFILPLPTLTLSLFNPSFHGSSYACVRNTPYFIHCTLSSWIAPGLLSQSPLLDFLLAFSFCLSVLFIQNVLEIRQLEQCSRIAVAQGLYWECIVCL